MFVEDKKLREKEWGPLFKETRDNLMKLNEVAGPNYSDLADRCYSAAVSQKREETYMNRNGVKKTTGRRCFHRLIGIKNCKGVLCSPPGNDHGNLWIKDGEPYSYTFEPYNLNKETLRKLIAVCDEYNLTFDISNDSFHFPAATTLVEIKKK